MWIAQTQPVLTEGGVENFPLAYQIACILLTGLFLWAFSIARDPRGWRRLYQTKFTRAEDISVNRNKRLDELIKFYALIVSMVFLVADVSLFVLGITYEYRHTSRSLTKEERFRAAELEKY